MFRWLVIVATLVALAILSTLAWRWTESSFSARAMRRASAGPTTASPGSDSFKADWQIASDAIRRHKATRAPVVATDAEIAQLLERMLDPEDPESSILWRELRNIGSAAEPQLLAALHDARFRGSAARSNTGQSPFEQVVELLAELGNAAIVPEVAPLIVHADEEVAIEAALQVASSGVNEAIAPILALLVAERPRVRSYAFTGIARACAGGRATPEFRRQIFDALVAEAQKSTKRLHDVAQTLINLDRDRAAAALSGPPFLAVENIYLYQTIEALNQLDYALPQPTVHAMLADARRHPMSYPWDYVVAACLINLGIAQRSGDLPIIEAHLNSESETVRSGAASALQDHAGLCTLSDLVDLKLRNGWSKLTPAQQHVLALWEVDFEVRNGGFDQYFFNSSGDHYRTALEACRLVGAHQTLALLEQAAAPFGPQGPSPDQEKRIEAMAPFDAEQERKRLDALEKDFYRNEDRMEVLIARYMLANAADFPANLGSPQ